MYPELKAPCSFEEVQQKEKNFIKAVRRKAGRTENEDYVGLALSGGGIRSAAFQLGVLQALATHGVLNFIDYFSSVSGGGYTAGWFLKWFVDDKAKKREEVSIDALKIVPGQRESDRILWMRKHSNYLTPHVGWFRHDSIFLATTYLQSLIFNLLVLFIFLSAFLLLVPGSVLGVLMSLHQHVVVLEVTGGALALGALFLILLRMVYTGESKTPSPFLGQYLVQAGVLSIALLFAWWPTTSSWVTKWLMVFMALICLFWKKNNGAFGNPALERRIRALACTLVIVPFIICVELSHVCPHWPAIIFFAWLWAVPIDHLFVQRKISQRKRRWTRTIAAGIGALSITAFMVHRQDRKEIEDIAFHYNKLSHFMLAHRIEAKIVLLSVLLLLIISVILLGLSSVRKILRAVFSRSIKFGFASIATAAGCYFTLLRYQAILRWIDKKADLHWQITRPLHVLAILTPLCIVAGTLQFSFTVALLGNLVSPAKRERIWADCTTMYRFVLALVFLVIAAIYAPACISVAPGWLQLCFICLWLCSLMISFWQFRFSHGKSRISFLMNLVFRLSTYWFALGLLVLVSISDNEMIKVEIADKLLPYGQRLSTYFDQFAHSFMNSATWIYAVAVMAVSVLLMAVLDVNLSSMHYFFQGRVARAFLLESLPGSQWILAPSTKADKMLSPPSGLYEFTPEKNYYGPLPIFNAALNMGVTNVLDWQDRKAANFIFTPYFSGFDNQLVSGEFILDDGSERKSAKKNLSEHAYAATESYKYGEENGIRLAAAMAISGSAIGSAMGSLTSVRTRLVHTFLNLRLGWWLPNPRISEAWNMGKLPQWWTVFKELLGWADAEGGYVHLSDGGHFENLGVYELVKRKCRVIIISDASEDKEATFNCLSIAIQKCRIDLNCIIDLDITPVSPRRSGLCEKNFVIGSINYGQPTLRGIIVYLRPTITQHQPTALTSFYKADGIFPHHPTINQWFSEALFEAYREMGQFVAEAWIKELHPTVGSSMTDVDLIARCDAMAPPTSREP